jgi:hypothetical protein
MFSEFETSLTDLYNLVLRRIVECEDANIQSYNDLDDKKNGTKDVIFIVNEYQKFCNTHQRMLWFDEMINKILERADDVGVHLFLLSQSNKNALSDKTVKKFPIRIVTPIDEMTSNLFIGNNAAAMDSEVAGVIWVKTAKYYPSRLYVPFYPDTWIRKFIGYYSVRDKDVNRHV